MGSEERPSGAGAWLYTKTLARSGVVQHAAVGKFRPDEQLVVFAKQNVLELLAFGEDGELQSVCEQPVFGTVRDIAVVPGSSLQADADAAAPDLLAVVSDSGRLSFLAVGADRFRAVGHVALAKHGSSDRRELGRALAVDPRGRCVAVTAFEGLVCVYPLVPAAACPADEGRRLAYAAAGAAVWDVAFLEPAAGEDARLALLLVPPPREGAAPGDRAFELHIVPVDLARGALAAPAVHRPDPSAGDWRPYRIAAVPGRPGALLVFEEAGVALLDTRRPSLAGPRTPLPPPPVPPHPACSAGAGLGGGVLVEALAWEAGGRPAGPRALYATTEHGDLLELLVPLDPLDDRVEVTPLGRVGECAAIASPGGGLLLLPCQHGDGAVVQLSGQEGRPPASPGRTLEVRQEIPNLAPLFDFALVDFDGENQDQLFACSGMGEAGGSVRVVRNGIGVRREAAALASGGPTANGLWTLRGRPGDAHHKYLVISFAGASRVLTLEADALVDVTEASGFLDVDSLACGHTGYGDWLLQAHRRGLVLARPHPAPLDAMEEAPPEHRLWEPPGGETVSLAAAGGGHIVLGLSAPTRVLHLALGPPEAPGGPPRLAPVGAAEVPHELSCLEIPAPEACRPHPLAPGGPAVRWWEGLCLVGTYRPSLLALALADPARPAPPALLGAVPLQAAGHEGVPESARLLSTDRPALFVGLRDGSVLHFDWRPFLPREAAAAGGLPGPLAAAPSLRRIGVLPIQLIHAAGLCPGLVALSDRPWLASWGGPPAPAAPSPPSSPPQPAPGSSPPRPRPSPSPPPAASVRYTSISFGAATHAAPFVSPELPRGVCFVTDDGVLHLCSLQPSRKLNVRTFPMRAAFPPAPPGPAAGPPPPPAPRPLPFYPTRLLFHPEARALAVLCSPAPTASLASRVAPLGVPPADVRLVDPLAGETLLAWPLQGGEFGTALCRYRPDAAAPALLAVGTAIGMSGLACPAGRLLLFRVERREGAEEGEEEEGVRVGSSRAGRGGLRMTLVAEHAFPGAVAALAPFQALYLLATSSERASLFALEAPPEGGDDPAARRPRPPRLVPVASVTSRCFFSAAAAGAGRLLLADRQDSLAFYGWRPGLRKLGLLRGDPRARCVLDAAAPDDETAVGVDAAGVLFLAAFDEDDVDAHCERNLRTECEAQLGELAVRLRQGSLAYRGAGPAAAAAARPPAMVACTLLGSLVGLAGVAPADFAALAELQRRLAAHAETRPALGHDHAALRGEGCAGGAARHALDGDLLAAFPACPPALQRELVEGWPGEAGAGPTPEALCRLIDALDQRLV